MSAQDYSDWAAYAKRLQEQAEANAAQMRRSVEQEYARMGQLTDEMLHLASGSLPRPPEPRNRAEAIAAELNANPELKAKVMALVGDPAPPAPG